MPIYYYIDLDCAPRRKLGAEELVAKVQSDVLANSVVEQVRQKSPDVDEDQMQFTRKTTAADGSEAEETMTVTELREQTKILDELKHHCEGCPAALAGLPYGCIQSVSFPISRRGEAWLLDRIGTGDTHAGRLFRASVVQMEYGKCDTLQQWRDAGFLEHQEPFVRIEKGDPVELSSDQILHAMFMSGELAPVRALSILLFTQALSLTTGGDTGDVIETIQAIQQGKFEGESPEFVFKLVPQRDDPPTLFEIKTFLYALFRAFSNNTPVAIRMQT